MIVTSFGKEYWARKGITERRARALRVESIRHIAGAMCGEHSCSPEKL